MWCSVDLRPLLIPHRSAGGNNERIVKQPCGDVQEKPQGQRMTGIKGIGAHSQRKREYGVAFEARPKASERKSVNKTPELPRECGKGK